METVDNYVDNFTPIEDLCGLELLPGEPYAMYLRKSRADMEAEKFGEKETLSRHKEILTAMCKRYKIRVVEIYAEVVSGETIEARPQIQRLIHDCYEGKYRGIVVIDVDRLSRGNQGDCQIIMDCLRYSNNCSGLTLITPTKTYDVAHNPDDEEYIEFVLFMSRREYKTIQKRLDRGRKQAVIEGNYMGSYRPYGYDIAKSKVARWLVPNPHEAPVVRQIFDLCVNGHLTPGLIAKELTEQGIHAYRGGEWSNASVKTILTNPTYMGKVRWNDRMEVKRMENGKIVKSRPRSNHTEQYMESRGKHEPLVSEEMFMAASNRFYSDKSKAATTLKNPFATILVCKNCGKALCYQGTPKKPTVQPRYAHPQSILCKQKSVFASTVMEAVCDKLKAEIENCEVTVKGTSKEEKKKALQAVGRMQAEVEAERVKIGRLFDALENGVITSTDFVERRAKIEARIATIEKKIEAAEQATSHMEVTKDKIVKLHEAIDLLMAEEVSAKEKNIFLKSLIKRIVYDYQGDTLSLEIEWL